MLIAGSCFGIHSERRLSDKVHPNLAYRWFCRLGLEGDVLDHSTFSKNPHGRFRDSDLLREVFETTVRCCMDEGLVGGEGFAVDASLIKADANRQSGCRAVTGCRPRSQTMRCASIWPCWTTLPSARRRRSPKFISPAAPATRWTAAHGGQAFFAYATNYLIDLKHAAIMDLEATTAVRHAEVGAAWTMIERTQDRFGAWPKKLVADAAYGSAENLAWLVHERGIEPHVPVFDKSQRRDGTFSRSDFAYDHDRDLYICPGGKELWQFRCAVAVPRGGIDREGLMRYRAVKRDCDTCSLKPRCCPKELARKLLRPIHEGARNMGTTSPPPMPTSPRDANGSRSRCCSRT
ncbi:transposase [Boseaceae bacterium BT-24-1]|nr:transposase [Boseaceae bacterium BT-24-1]